MRRLAVAALLPALVVGCGHHEVISSGPSWSPSGFPHTAAVALLANDTLSVEGPQILRVRMRRVLLDRGYDVQRLGDTDAALRGIGVSLGGQIPQVSWAQLRAALGTDAVVTGKVIKYQTVVAGLVNTRTVEAEIALTDLRDGHVLWHARDTVKAVDNGLDEGARVASNAGDPRAAAIGCLIVGCVGAIFGATQHDMRNEAGELAVVLARSLPPAGPPMAVAPGAVVASLSIPKETPPSPFPGIVPLGASLNTR